MFNSSSVLRLGAKGLLVKHLVRFVLASSLVLSIVALHSTTTFAVACAPGTPLDASGGSAVCTMSIAATINPGVLTLANDAAAVVTGTPFTLTGATQTAPFTFTSVVKDHRGVTAGWSLQAASPGLVLSGAPTIPILLTAKDAASTCTNGSCPVTNFTAITLTATPAKFLQAGVTGAPVVVDGDYSNKTDGTFSIPAGTPSGSYAGTITITLANAF